jgi:hypothetical protein
VHYCLPQQMEVQRTQFVVLLTVKHIYNPTDQVVLLIF